MTNANALLFSFSSMAFLWPTDVRATCVASVSPSNNNNCGPGNLVVVSYTDGSLCLLDVNTGNKPLLNFENDKTSLINSVVVHPTMPVVVSAHEDRQIKFWDLNNGKLRRVPHTVKRDAQETVIFLVTPKPVVHVTNYVALLLFPLYLTLLSVPVYFVSRRMVRCRQVLECNGSSLG